MQIFRLITVAVMLAAMVAVSAFAQTRPAGRTTPTATPAATPAPTPAATTPAARPAAVPDTKIAFVDTRAFGDEKVGIVRYVNAVKSLEVEFKPRQDELINLQTRLNTITTELGKLSGNSVVDPKTIQTKQEEGERIQRDIKYKKEQADADFTKRYQAVVGPISADIGKALDQFAAQRGITMILDIGKLEPAILTLNPAMDVTLAFITDYNSKNPATR